MKLGGEAAWCASCGGGGVVVFDGWPMFMDQWYRGMSVAVVMKPRCYDCGLAVGLSLI